MKISKVQAQLSSYDLLSIINEFLKVEGLVLEEIKIDKVISLKGSYTKGLNIDFSGDLEVIGVKNNKIHLKFAKFKVFKLGFLRQFRSLGLKMIMKYIPIDGIENIKDEIIIDIDKLLFEVPYVEFKILDIFVRGDILYAEVEKVNISIVGGIIKEKEEEIEEDLEEEIIGPINKVKDTYSIGRKNLEEKIPAPIDLLSDYVLVIPDILALIYRLLKDDRVSLKTKIIISASIAYVAVPSDFIPRKIPFIGKIDDLAVVFFALNRVVNDVPINILLENWEGKNELIIVIKSGLDYIVNFTKAKNVEKLYCAIEELKTL